MTGVFRLDRRIAFRCLLAILLLLVTASSALPQPDPPLHFYDSAIGKTGMALKSALQNIIGDHTVLPYTSSATDTWDAVKVLDEGPADPSTVVLIYSGLSDAKSAQYTGTSGTWDREHLWPQSFGITVWNANSQAKTDLFNLRPIDATVNSSRGNKYYDDSTAPASTHWEAPASTYDNNSWEPRDADKGLIARSLFYMAVRYDGSDPDVPDLELSDSPNPAEYRFGRLSTLLAWHREVSVEASEERRNQRVYAAYQHNRNPFVDNPDYAEMVFNGASPGEAWKLTRFSAAEIVDSSISGDAADPDADGVCNLLEYVFNRNPRQAEASAPIVSTGAVGDGRYMLLSYSHNRNATDVGLSFERTSDLQNWETAPAEQISATITRFDTQLITVRVPVSGPRCFVRIRATRN